MKPIKNQKGLTLVEIIVAITIIGMLVVGISGMLDLSVKQIFHAGARTQETMIVQEVVDQLQERNNSNTLVPFDSDTGIGTWLNAYQTNPSYGINYQISSLETFGSSKGWTVTITKEIKNSSRTVQLSTFVVNHHL